MLVTGAGNEGTALLHGSGTIKPDGQVTTHEFNIDENQKKRLLLKFGYKYLVLLP